MLCSFWLVSCLARAGEVDTTNGEQLGNFPQACSHIGLITSAWEIDQARARRER